MDVFRKIPFHHLAALEPRLAVRRFKKGSSLFREGDVVKFIWFVREGRLKAVKHLPQGRDLTVCSLGPRQLFGTCCCFASPHYPCNPIAETDVTVVSLPMTDFVNFMRHHPEISNEIIATLSSRLRQAKNARAWEQESVEKRILHVLAQLLKESGENLPYTRKAIAEMAGTTVETSIRTFRVFQKQGLVETSRGRIHIKNSHALFARLTKNP